MQYRYEGNIFSGEKRSELLVVPAFSVRVSPEIAIVPAAFRRVPAPAARHAAAARPRRGGRSGAARRLRRGAAGVRAPPPSTRDRARSA